MERALLAFLLLEPGALFSAEDLVDRLWGDCPSEQSRGTLSTYITRLRRRLRTAVGDKAVIPPSNGGYRIEVDPDTIDLHKARNMVRRAQALAQSGQPEAAVDLLIEYERLWRGTPLAGLPGDRIETLRTSLGSERRAARLQRVELELGLGRHHELIGELQRFVRQSPLDEPWVELLMTALYRSGRTPDALRLYQEYLTRLWDDGLDPGPELRDLHARILAGDVGLAVTPAYRRPRGEPQPDTLLPDVSPFIGRGAEIERLTRTAGSPDTRPVWVIEGMAGVGKTALATHTAHLVTGRYPDARLYLDLHGYDATQAALDPHDALFTLLTDLGVTAARIAHTPRERAALWQSEMARRRAVLVLDNAHEPDQIRPLLPSTPTCLVLITSRRRLTGLDDATALPLDVLPEPDAVTLFSQLIAPNGVNREDAARVVRRCGRLPMAIHLAASRVRTGQVTGVGEMLRRCDTPRPDHGSATLELPELTAAFDGSYLALAADERRLLRWLAQPPCPDVTAYAAAALTGMPEPDAVRVLASLRDHHLLREVAPGRYRFHDIVRDYAARRGDDEDTGAERLAAMKRRLACYVHSAREAAGTLFSQRRLLDRQAAAPKGLPSLGGEEAASGWMAQECSNSIPLILHAAVKGWYEPAILLADAFARHFDLAGRWREAQEVHRRVADACRELGDQAGESRALTHLGWALFRTGDNDDAEAATVRAATVSRSVGDRHGQAEALDACGLVYWMTGRFQDALAHFQEAHEIFDRLGWQPGRAGTLNHCAIVLFHLGRFTEAETSCQRALELSRALGDPDSEGMSLNNLGDIRLVKGLHRDAARLYAESYAIFEARDGRQYKAILANNLGNVSAYKGDHATALDHYHTAAETYQRDDDRRNLADVYNNIGLCLSGHGREDEAVIYHERALRLAEEIGDPYEQTRARYGLGEASRGLCHHHTALDHYRCAVARAREIEDPYLQAKALDGMAGSLLHVKDSQAARIQWWQAHNLFARLGVPDADRIAGRLEHMEPGRG